MQASENSQEILVKQGKKQISITVCERNNINAAIYKALNEDMNPEQKKSYENIWRKFNKL